MPSTSLTSFRVMCDSKTNRAWQSEATPH
jgi:hypothetical protein